MQSVDDMQLLRQYAATRSEEAFAALVSRHVNLVYSAALRQVRNPHYAEEIVQAVFLILAQKCRGLRPGVVLSGWLYQTARLASANFLRGEQRRQRREQEAYMQSSLHEGSSKSWPQVAPLLDEAIARLNEKDRNAVVMRYFEDKEMREIAAALGASEDAAKMRLSRALEKLRSFFARRGVSLTAGGLGALISEFSVQAAPTGLAASVASGVCGGSAFAASTLTLTKGTLTMMAWTKINIGIAAVAVAAVAYQWHEASAANRKAADLQQQLDRQTEVSRQQQAQAQELQGRNTALQQQMASLFSAQSAAPHASAGIGAEAALAKAGGNQAGGGISGTALEKFFKDPAMKKMMEDQQKTFIKNEYGDLVKQLKLTPAQADQFFTLLADQQASNMDRGFKIMSGGASAAEIGKAAQDSMASNDAQMRALLGDDGFAQYKDYSESLVDRTLLNQMLPSFSDDPLTSDQQKQLLQIMRTARQSSSPVPGQAEAPANPGDFTGNMDRAMEQQEQANAQVLQQASAFLSPEQLQTLGNSQSNFISMQKASMTMMQSMFGSNMPPADK